MDIHRSRFVPYPSSAINALAFSHTEPEHGNQDPESLRLAIGRANGNIEIWNLGTGSWLQEKVLYGGKDRSVEGLVWTQEPDRKEGNNKLIPGRLRLFSIGYSSSVTEWDLATGLPLRHSNGSHSEVWCFAAQPRQKGDTHQKIVAGCADGTIVLLSTENDDLTFDRFVSRATNKKARALSIAYKDKDIVLAGFADSTIRVFDTRNGSIIRNISLGSGPRGGPKEILVWKVKCLPNGDFISGDSTGEIRFFSGKNYGQSQRIAGHEADVLDLAVSRDGTSIFSAGMDRRTCFYTSKKSAAKIEGQHGKWRKVSHQRYHQHDVKALATYEGSKLNIVVSGGIDTQPIIVPLRQFGKEFSRGLPALPPVPPLTSASEARLLVSWWNTELRIWRVKAQYDGTEKPKVVARLAIQGEENIVTASISQDGGLLAVSTTDTVKLFQLIQPQPGAGASLRIRKVHMPAFAGAKNVRISANGKWLSTVSATNEIEIARIVRGEDMSELPRVLNKRQRLHRLERGEIPQTRLRGPSGLYERSITHAEFSADANVFAVVDLAGYVDTWVVEGHEDSTAPEVDIDEGAAAIADGNEMDDDDEIEEQEQIIFLGQHWTRNPSAHLIPRLDSTPVLLSFQPNFNDSRQQQPNGNPAVHATRHNPHPHSHELPVADYRLLLVSAEHQIYLFDVMTGRLSEWSRRNPPSSYPREYQQVDLPAKGCIWNTSEGQQRLWLYGEKWLFMFDLLKDFTISGKDGGWLSKKRKMTSSGAGDSIPEREIPVAKLRKFDSSKRDDSGKIQWMNLDDSGHVYDEDKDDAEGNSRSLAILRRGSAQSGGQVTGPMVTEEQKENPTNQQTRGESWWHTFKYRPIMGILPIGDSTGRSTEVVLVERPSWDLELPPRFVGTYEQ
ncbi:U3 small nucleolar RNA-associated protein [Pleosporales sp. CAS-2024a]